MSNQFEVLSSVLQTEIQWKSSMAIRSMQAFDGREKRWAKTTPSVTQGTRGTLDPE